MNGREVEQEIAMLRKDLCALTESVRLTDTSADANRKASLGRFALICEAFAKLGIKIEWEAATCGRYVITDERPKAETP